MPYHLPQLDAARRRGSAVTSEMEVFLAYCPCRVFGVTGSDGKTTTTTILSKMLEKAGLRVHVGGNIVHAASARASGKSGPTTSSSRNCPSFQLISTGTSPRGFDRGRT